MRADFINSLLGALKAGLQKRGSCLPRLGCCIGTIALHPLFIRKGMGGIGVRCDFDALVMFRRSRTQPVHILAGHPLVLSGLVIEYRAEQIGDRSIRLHHSTVIDDRCAEPFPLTGEPECVRSTHAVADHTVDVLFNVVAGI